MLASTLWLVIAFRWISIPFLLFSWRPLPFIEVDIVQLYSWRF
ncbi:hypothetical protein BN2497_905 [Janthinobacterium sp. CG23_2]|nr:hypothetical protein BN2497_905 [Janthinobacterium sp. CG23_2]CUU26850.1 hypothetical protein BN3177_905 [Janthinobacterium sp. CG23_2]